MIGSEVDGIDDDKADKEFVVWMKTPEKVVTFDTNL